MQYTFARVTHSAEPLYARCLCSRDALGLKAGRPSAARDDRVSCIQAEPMQPAGQARRVTKGLFVYKKNSCFSDSSQKQNKKNYSVEFFIGRLVV